MRLNTFCPFFIRLNLLGSAGVWKKYILAVSFLSETVLWVSTRWCVAFNPFNSIFYTETLHFYIIKWWVFMGGLWVLNKSLPDLAKKSSWGPLSYLWHWWVLSHWTEEWWGGSQDTFFSSWIPSRDLPTAPTALSVLSQPGHQTPPPARFLLCRRVCSMLEVGLLCIPCLSHCPGNSTCT